MKKFVSLFISISFIFTACSSKEPDPKVSKKSDSEVSKQWAEKLATKICDKIISCTEEAMKNLPESRKKEIKKDMLTKDKCYKETMKDLDSSSEPVALTPKEIRAAKECAEAISSAKCIDLQNNNIPACKKYEELIKNK